MLTYRKYYVLENAKAVEQRPALEQKTEMHANIVQILFAEIVDSHAIEIDLTRSRSEQRNKMLYQDGLAASARPYYNGRLALLYRQRDIIQNQMRPEPLRNLLNRQYPIGLRLGRVVLTLLSCQILSTQILLLILRDS